MEPGRDDGGSGQMAANGVLESCWIQDIFGGDASSGVDPSKSHPKNSHGGRSSLTAQNSSSRFSRQLNLCSRSCLSLGVARVQPLSVSQMPKSQTPI